MTAYILSGSRTASGSLLGNFKSVPAAELGAIAIKDALSKAGLQTVDEVFMGTVLQAGQGQNPARQACLAAGLSDKIPCTTINKVCGSGLKTIITAAQAIKCHDIETAVAGGMENMSMAPHLLPTGRTGVKFGATEIKDHMQWDGLWDIYSDNAMGILAENCPEKLQISRKQQDDYAIASYRKAQLAAETGVFSAEIAIATIKNRKGEVIVKEDQGPYDVNFDKLTSLRPAFKKEGTITAANASTINDGGAAVILGGEQYKDQAKFKIVAYASFASDPQMFATAPIGAIENCLKKASMELGQIDLFEINEAFACVPIAAINTLNIPEEKVNIFGGGVSLGHPIGQSGTRIVVTLMNALEHKEEKFGLASICIGGGEALAMIIERL